jgi:hypothetical protein
MLTPAAAYDKAKIRGAINNQVKAIIPLPFLSSVPSLLVMKAQLDAEKMAK